nr:cell division cycle protein 23 [Hymenolepis microstoma]
MQFDPEIASVNFSLVKIRNDLQLPLINCQIRGLVSSCSWIAELLLSIQQTLSKSESSLPSTSPGSLLAAQYDGLSLENFSTYNLAKCYFDNKDFLRCSHLLSPLAGSHPLIDFLFFYSRYMAIEKKGTDEAITNKEDSSKQPVFPYSSDTYRKALFELKTDIERKYGAEEVIQGTSINAFLSSNVDVYTAYVLALVYIRLGCQKPALKILSHIVKKDSLLWPAWFEMSKLFEDRENFDRAFPPVTTVDNGNWMRAIFRAKALLNFQDTERALAILTCLSNGGFHNSLNLQADIADAHEKLRDHDVSATIYKNIFTVDPYRLTDSDIYSNVLFVKADHEELAFLARRCSEIDKYRPETCCVLGNFYGLRGQHDKAVLYFQRALRLQPRYVLVWILLGHEYVEMQHLQLAIYAYNQAIMHNRYDHRGWYGLGQLYEFIKQPQHALYYYKRAQYLCPSDSRVIVALGDMYEQQNNIECAKMCFWRAYCVGDVEGTALFSLARCYERSGNDCEAAAAYTQFIRQCESRGVSNETDLGQAYRFLANYHFRYGHHSDAVVAINKCLDFPEIREEAKALCLQVTLISGSGSGTLGDATHQMLPPALPSTPEAKRNTTADLVADRPVVRARRRLRASDFTTNTESMRTEAPSVHFSNPEDNDNSADFD